MPRQRIAVIGGVAAGPAAAAQAVRVDPEADVVLYEKGPAISYGACEMPYYVAGQIDEADRLVVLSPEAFERTRGATVRVGHEVVALHPRRCRLSVRDHSTGHVTEARFDKFILAVGARARWPEIDGLDAPNVFALRRLEEARALRAFLDAAPVQHAVVLGGGYVGVEVADALRVRGVRVSVLEPGGHLLPGYLDADLQPLVDEAARRRGVVVRPERAVAAEQGPDGRVRAVKTDRGEKVGCQLVVVAIGVTPNTALAEAAGVRRGRTGALAVDAYQRTNLPNVWACGDCAEVERVLDGVKIHLPLSPVAFRTARVAAANAARRGHGAPARFPGVVGASAVHAFGLEVAVVGLRLDEAQAAGFDAVGHTIRHPSRARLLAQARPVHVRLIAERCSGRLLGAQLVGEEGAVLRADVLVPCLRDRWTVNRINDLDLIYAPPFAPSMDPLLVAANETAKRVGRR